MKFLIPLITLLLLGTKVQGQTMRGVFYNEVTFFLKENGESLSRAEFEKILKENASTYHRWDQIENDSIRISRLIPKKETFNVSYPEIYKALEVITQSTFQGNPLIIIHYNFVGDFCSPASGFNNWDTLRIRRNKRFSDNLNRRLENEFPNVIALHFFEPGITIEPSQILKQFFYIDHSGFFRNTLFKIPSSCGSIAIIMPGGNTTIFNGETSIPVIAGSLQD
ncbi:hypothetical protein BH23BAC2_BH23BAC2_25650 [soil metagenome]